MKKLLEIMNEKKSSSSDNDTWIYKLDMDIQTLKDKVEKLEKKVFELENTLKKNNMQ